MPMVNGKGKPVNMAGRGFDIAYGAYGFLGAVALWTARVIYPGSPPDGTSQYEAFVTGLGFFVAIPFGLPAVAAVIVAWWLSFRLSRDIWLMSLLLVSLAFVSYLFVWSRLESGWIQWVPVLLYGATCTISGLWWFLIRRWRSARPRARASGSSGPRSKLTRAGRWLTLLSLLALIAKGAALRSGDGRLLLFIAALLNLATIVAFPAGLICWIIGAFRDRRSGKAGTAGSQESAC